MIQSSIVKFNGKSIQIRIILYSMWNIIPNDRENQVMEYHAKSVYIFPKFVSATL